MLKLSTVALKRASLYERISEDYATEYDPKTDRVVMSFSIGRGKSSTKLILDQDDLGDVAAVLASFEEEELTAAQIVQRTLAVEIEENGDKILTFKVSNAPNTRQVRLPWNDRADLVRFLDEASEGMDDLRERYRDLVAKSS